MNNFELDAIIRRDIERVLRHGLPFERQSYGVNKPGAWRRLYTTLPGYCREFGWRACFLGGGCE